jgi:ferrous-iron efflux pump FieF
VAILVAAGVFRTAWRLIWDAAQVLTDRALPEEETEVIQRVVAAFTPEVLGFHDLRTRRSGPHRFVELHLEIPRETSFQRAHDLIVQVMDGIERELPRSRVTIHGDPVDPARADELRRHMTGSGSM